MRRITLFILVVWLTLAVSSPTLFPVQAQEGTEDIARGQRELPPAALVAADNIVRRMSVADKVGQLFVVTFVGNSTAPESAIAELIARYRVGGVLLLASNDNFRNDQDAPRQVLSLTNRLQALAYGHILPEEHSLSPSPDVLIPLPPRLETEVETSIPITSAVNLPLFIIIDQEGDGPPYTRLYNGFTPLPSQMALGATWNPALAREVGAIVGRELAAVGVNVLLGPSLDVVVSPRPELRGDFGARVFGGDPYWVAQMGKAYIAGVHEGSQGRVLTVAKHFPGQGSADRRPDEEVATVAKSLSELRKIELAPFSEVTRLGPGEAITVTDGLLSSHIRYEGFQGNIRERTPPITLAPELQDILDLPEFRQWHEHGGILITDALGALAVRRYKDPSLHTFPYKQVALEALLAGNDLLLLSQFSISGTFEEQYQNTVDTIRFFQEKYVRDPAFRERVDEAVKRIVARKLALYPSLALEEVLRSEADLAVLGKGQETVDTVARAAATLLYPSPQDLSDRLPAPPQAEETILFLLDDRPFQECATCPLVPAIPSEALAQITLALYGPNATNQILPEQVRSLPFERIRRFLDGLARGEEDEEVAAAFAAARWVVVGMTRVPADEYPDRDVVSRLLREGRELLQDKHLIVFAFNAPYYLDATEITNLTAYYALYSKTPPFLEAAVRLLFREFVPTGSPPVSVPALNYDLRVLTEPNPDQTIGLTIVEFGHQGEEPAKEPMVLDLGDTFTLRTSVIYDHQGHPVPDGTPVEFHLWYPAESLEFRRETVTRNGVAEAQITVDRPGELWITVSSLKARTSTQLLLNIRPGEPSIVETVIPTPTPTITPTPSPSPTSTPTPTSTATPTATPTFTPTPVPPRVVQIPWAGGDALLMALLGLMVISMGSGWLWYVLGERADVVVRWAAWEWILGLTAYVAFSLGMLPGAERWRLQIGSTAGGIVATMAALIPPLIWAGWRIFVPPTPPARALVSGRGQDVGERGGKDGDKNGRKEQEENRGQ